MLKVRNAIRWTERNGNITTVSVSLHATPEEAEKARIGLVSTAKKLGWPGSPKWWQWWRKMDTRIEEQAQ